MSHMEGPGLGRRDLRRHVKAGALKKSHRKKNGCPLTLLLLLALPTGAAAALWKIAAVVTGATS